MYENDSFKGRINELYSESKLTIDKFAQKCHVSRAAMQNYINGDRIPDGNRISIICKEFSVTADWLLGLSDTRTPSADIQNAINALGISEKAALKMYAPELGNPWGSILSKMIESERFTNLITTYKIFLVFLSKLKAEDLEKINDYELRDDCVVLGRNEAIFHYKEQVCSAISHLCEENYNNRVQELIQDVQGPFTLSMEPFNIKLHRDADEKAKE